MAYFHWSSSPALMWPLLTSFYFLISTLAASEYRVKDNVHNSDDHEVRLFQHFNEPYDQMSYGKLNVEVIETTTSSIHVKWQLTNLTFLDSVAVSTVICETYNGKIVSDEVHATSNSFRFQFLQANTRYVVCVYMIEKSKVTNTSLLHYSCRPFNTIPIVRSDSIIGVILALGYIFLMAGIGYVTWYRRMKKLKRNEEEEKIDIEETEDDTPEETLPGKAGISGVGRSGSRGILNCAADNSAADNFDAVNGLAGYKERSSSRGDCTGTCVPFRSVEEEEPPPIEYDANKREISF